MSPFEGKVAEGFGSKESDGDEDTSVELLSALMERISSSALTGVNFTFGVVIGESRSKS